MEQSKFYQIKNVTEHEYTLVGCDGSVITRPTQDVDKSASAFTIQDAKDGDVLACENGWTCIFKALDKHTNTFSSYCFMDKDKWFCNTGSEGHTLDERFVKAYNEEIHPATKEQCDILFSKIKEAGYEWDAEKKELKKIEQKPWSEEDEVKINRIVTFLENLNVIDKDILLKDVDWLKSLKDRVQPRQEWSEEDEKILNSLISSLAIIGASTRTDSTSINYTFSKEIDWLKSLRPQNRWKPSDEQIIALRWVLNNIPYNKHKEEISGLLDQIKEL